MSVTRSSSTDSLSSSNTTAITQLNEQQIDPSNILYNDHQNYQIIFTNDCRFFDTSLHLFKSYRDLGYIQLDDKKSKKHLFSTSTSTLKTESNGNTNRKKSKRPGFSSNQHIDGNNNGTLKPQLSRNDRAHSQRSDPGSSNSTIPKVKRDSSYIVSQQRQWTPSNHSPTNGDSSDDPDIIVTRL